LSDLFVGFLFIFIIFLMLFALLLAETQKKTEVVTSRLTDAGKLRTQMLEEIQQALKRIASRELCKSTELSGVC
jgi:large-conductance mechanosensitive channel